MSKGTEYARKLDEIVRFMYDRGAIGGTDVVKLHQIQENVGIDEVQGLRLMKLLIERGFVKAIVPKVFRLTGSGFDEAARLPGQLRDQGTRAPSRPIGFPEPDKPEEKT